MQITQVPWDPKYWAQIAKQGHVSVIASPEDLAADLMEAIRGKSGRYSEQDRATLVLVLDATRHVVYDLPATLAAFRERCLEEARCAGFADIFLVGKVRFINLLNPPTGSAWFSVA
jgi:hypothetical protein